KALDVARDDGSKSPPPSWQYPARLTSACEKTIGLIKALDRGHDADAGEIGDAFERLRNATEAASKALDALRGEFDERVNLLPGNRGSDAWRQIDDALTVPLIAPAVRGRLILQSVASEEPDERPGPVSAGSNTGAETGPLTD